MDTQKDRQIYKWRNRGMGRYTNGQTVGWAAIQMDKQNYGQTEG